MVQCKWVVFNSGDSVGGNNPSQSSVTGNGIVPVSSDLVAQFITATLVKVF